MLKGALCRWLTWSGRRHPGGREPGDCRSGLCRAGDPRLRLGEGGEGGRAQGESVSGNGDSGTVLGGSATCAGVLLCRGAEGESWAACPRLCAHCPELCRFDVFQNATLEGMVVLPQGTRPRWHRRHVNSAPLPGCRVVRRGVTAQAGSGSESWVRVGRFPRKEEREVGAAGRAVGRGDKHSGCWVISRQAGGAAAATQSGRARVAGPGRRQRWARSAVP